jgi:hypothetical protein
MDQIMEQIVKEWGYLDSFLVGLIAGLIIGSIVIWVVFR